MRLLLLLATLQAIVFAAGCSRWPPDHKNLTDRFFENRSAFEKLESKILSTNYDRVTGGCVLNSDRELVHTRVTLYWTEIDPVSGELAYKRESIQSEEWNELFCAAIVWSVQQYDGIVSLGFGSGMPLGEKFVGASYVHSEEQLSDRKACLPEHKKLECGLCAVPLDDAWFIEYWWTPDDILPDEYSMMIDGELSEEDYWSQFEQELKRCRVEGYQAIGYDTTGWWDSESNDR